MDTAFELWGYRNTPPTGFFLGDSSHKKYAYCLSRARVLYLTGLPEGLREDMAAKSLPNPIQWGILLTTEERRRRTVVDKRVRIQIGGWGCNMPLLSLLHRFAAYGSRPEVFSSG